MGSSGPPLALTALTLLVCTAVAALARLLAREGGSRPVHLLPAAGLPVAEVRQSLGWLRRQAGAVVMLPQMRR